MKLPAGRSMLKNIPHNYEKFVKKNNSKKTLAKNN